MSEENQVIDLAPAEEPAPPVPEEEAAPPPPPPLERKETALPPVAEEEPPKPKRRGRPPGSKSKPKPKPPPLVEEEIEEPRAPSRRVQMQTPDCNLDEAVPQPGHEVALAQTLLDLMHAQANTKANKRRQLYQSWF